VTAPVSGGGLVKAAQFRSYPLNERPEKFDRMVQSRDAANKVSELSDFSVCTSWGIKGKVREQCEAFVASVVLIERNRKFVDSPLEGDRFELLVPRHESRGFPKHPNRATRTGRRQLQLSRQRLAKTTTSRAGITISTKALSGMVRRTPSDTCAD
jgi:hypothetical protein